MSTRCDNCGGTLAVSDRQARRIRTGRSTARCGSCRGLNGAVATETAYRYWLTRFGVSVPRGGRALDVVMASGLPPDLADLARDFHSDITATR